MRTTPILQLPYPESTDSADVPRDIKALADKLDSPTAGGVFIIGEVRFIAIAAPPAGWLVADGRAVSRATYGALFAAIAAVFGPGDGSTTFNLPDARGRALVGAGQGTGLAMRTTGTKWGVEAIVLSTAQMPTHAHGATTGWMDRNNPHSHYIPSYPDLSGGILAVSNMANASSPTGAGTSPTDINHLHAIAPEGGGQGHDNTQPSIAIPAYIYAGV